MGSRSSWSWPNSEVELRAGLYGSDHPGRACVGRGMPTRNADPESRPGMPTWNANRNVGRVGPRARMAPMSVLVVLLAVVVALLAVLVTGLLRSHAEILRAL